MEKRGVVHVSTGSRPLTEKKKKKKKKKKRLFLDSDNSYSLWYPFST